MGNVLPPLSALHARTHEREPEQVATPCYLLPDRAVTPDERGALTVTLELTASPAKPGEAPPAIRLRQALKLLLRGFNIRARWAQPPTAYHHHQPKKSRCSDAR